MQSIVAPCRRETQCRRRSRSSHLGEEMDFQKLRRVATTMAILVCLVSCASRSPDGESLGETEQPVYRGHLETGYAEVGFIQFGGVLSNPTSGGYCTGTLISDRVVLT